MWTYYNGQKNGFESGVLYWTTEKDFDSAKLNNMGGHLSKETVLSYRYDTNNKQYSVIKNHVWLDQLGADGKTHHGLAQLKGEYSKPEGTTLKTFSTYEEAKQFYEQAKKDNNDSVFFK